jgi:hypothetical protein
MPLSSSPRKVKNDISDYLQDRTLYSNKNVIDVIALIENNTGRKTERKIPITPANNPNRPKNTYGYRLTLQEKSGISPTIIEYNLPKEGDKPIPKQEKDSIRRFIHFGNPDSI